MSVLNVPTAEVFLPLLAPARDKGAFGGRGSGKSHFFAGLMIEDCLAAPGDSGEGLRGVCLREVQKDLAQSAKRLIEAKLSAFGLGEREGFKIYREQIRTPGDGLLIFIEKAITALVRKQDSAVAWTIATLVTLLGGAIGMVFALMTQHR